MAGNSLYLARNVSYSTQTKMPPCFLYLSNTWSTPVLLPEFPSVFAWQRGSAHKTALCVLPPVPSPEEAPSPFLSAGQMRNLLLSSTEVHPRNKAGDTACAVMRHKKTEKAEQSPKTGGITRQSQQRDDVQEGTKRRHNCGSGLRCA